MISSSSLIESRLNSSTNRPDPDTESKVRSSVRAINETIQSNANEPSLAFYRIQVKYIVYLFVFFSEFLFYLGTCKKNSPNDDTKTN